MRSWLIRVLNLSAAGTSAFLTIWGLYSAASIDLRQNPLLSFLYCAFPILAFPLFVGVRKARIPAWSMATMACAYLMVYSMMNWRTCSAQGFCGSIVETVLLTLNTPPMLAFVVAALSIQGAQMLEGRRGIQESLKT